MRTLTIYTSLYKQELAEWVIPCFNKFLIEEGVTGNQIYYGMPHEKKIIAGISQILAELLKNIVLLDNPIVKESTRLYRTIGRIIFYGKHEIIFNELYHFLNENDCLNLDGYIQFVMHQYSEHINMILYSVVKKNFNDLYDLSYF